MYTKEDFNKTIVKVKVSFPIAGDPAHPKLLIRMEEVLAIETDKMFRTIDNKRVAKEKLLKPFCEYDMFLPEYQAYCLPGDEEKAAEVIRAALELKARELSEHLQGIYESTKAGVNIVNPEAYFDLTMKESEARRAAKRAVQDSSPEP